MKKVAVIGAGAAGLCAAKHLLALNISPVVFEQQDHLGGTWHYQDIDVDKPQQVYSSMYDNLRTNLPKQVMYFPDFPFPDEEPSFMHHTSVMKYVQDYADHYDLEKHVRFHERVLLVEPDLNDSTERYVKWKVETTNENSSTCSSDVFDHVIVCAGHYSVPGYPTIQDIENFKGKTLHSHYYRRPSDFKGQHVLIYGYGPSAIDIMVDLSETCEKIYFAHRHDHNQSKLPSNVVELPDISYVADDGTFAFENKFRARVDTFIPCTGYLYHYPFLSNQSGVEVVNGYAVKTLYKHIFNVKYPSMSFVNLPWKAVPFALIHQQCAYIALVIDGKCQLPSEEEMLSCTKAEELKRESLGEDERYYHKVGTQQFAYNLELSNLSGYQPNPPIIENLHARHVKMRFTDFLNFKNCEYKQIDDCSFEVLKEFNKKE